MPATFGNGASLGAALAIDGQRLQGQAWSVAPVLGLAALSLLALVLTPRWSYRPATA